MKIDKKTFVINGDNFKNMDEFYDEVERVLTKSLTWRIGRNLNAFNDVLWGGFNAFESGEPIKLVWRNAQESKKRLGESDFNELIEIILEHKHIEFISD
jgi:RNAse (barnase) inhibitor barstar